MVLNINYVMNDVTCSGSQYNRLLYFLSMEPTLGSDKPNSPEAQAVVFSECVVGLYWWLRADRGLLELNV